MKWTIGLVLALVVGQAQAQISERELYKNLDDLESWCDNVVRKLDAAEDRAVYLQHSGDFEQALDTMVVGLQRALDTGRYVTGLMTKKALERGIRNIKALE